MPEQRNHGKNLTGWFEGGRLINRLIPEVRKILAKHTAPRQLSPSARLFRVLFNSLIFMSFDAERCGLQVLALVLRTGAEQPSTATVVPAISCEATDLGSSASSIGKYPARTLAFRLSGEVVPAGHLTPGVAKPRMRRRFRNKTNFLERRLGSACTVSQLYVQEARINSAGECSTMTVLKPSVQELPREADRGQLGSREIVGGGSIIFEAHL